MARVGRDPAITPRPVLHMGITHMFQSGQNIYAVAAYVAKLVRFIQWVYAHHSLEHLEHHASLDRRVQ